MAEFLSFTVMAAALIYIISLYNRLVKLRQGCKQGLGDIDVQLRQRHDLIPNLVATVQGYAGHESDVLNAVIEARSRASSSASAGSDEAEVELGRSMERILALAESYPDLKASTNFVELQQELAEIEDKLAAARRAYNSAVARFNGLRESFPAVLVAPALGFKTAEFHTLGANEASLAATPSVKF